MNSTPHATRRNFVTLFVIGSLLTLIIVGLFSCTKSKPFHNVEPLPADHKVREWTKRLAYPNHGQGCDSTLNGGL